MVLTGKTCSFDMEHGDVCSGRLVRRDADRELRGFGEGV